MLKVGTLVQITIELLITIIMAVAGYNLHDMATDVKSLNEKMATMMEKNANHDREILEVRIGQLEQDKHIRELETAVAVLKKQLDDSTRRR